MRNKNILFLFLLVAAGFAVWYFKHIFIYIIIAAILSLIGQPMDRFYTKYLRFGKFRISATLSAGLAFLTLFAVLFVLAFFFVPLVLEETAILSSLDRDLMLTTIQKPLETADRLLRSMNIDYESVNVQDYFREKVMSFFTVTNLSLLLNQFINALGDFVIAVFAISFLTFFFLRDEEKIISAILSFVPSNYSERSRKVWNECERLLKRYFIGVFTEILLVITFLALGLWIAGIRHALLIALFAGLMNIVPYVGPTISFLFALFIGLTTTTTMSPVSVVISLLVIYPVVYFADAFLLQPFIYSSSVKAHPAEIFLVILAGAANGGIGGMILAVPSYTILRVFVKEFFSGFRDR